MPTRAGTRSRNGFPGPEGYEVEYTDGSPRLRFIEAIEERDDIPAQR